MEAFLRAIFRIIRILLVYTDNPSELCLREHYKWKLMNTDDKEPKKNAEVRGYANLLCDFMFKRIFGREANKVLTASDRLSADPVWNSIPGKKRLGLAQTVKLRPSEVKLILTFR